MKKFFVAICAWYEKISRVTNVIAGAGDYDAYLAHHQKTHADPKNACKPLSRAEFFAERENERGNRPRGCC